MRQNMVATYRRDWISVPLSVCLALALSITFTVAKSLDAPPPQDKKPPHPYWQPPDVDKPIPSLSPTPACSLPDVLKQAGQRAEKLLDHLQNFIAHERVRYEQTDRVGSLEVSGSGYFDFLVDFGDQRVVKVKELRNPLDAATDKSLSGVLDKGLPVLALIFVPDLQRDYEMSCEGSAQWDGQPVWVVHFRQIKGKHPRTMMMETATEARPHSQTTTEIRPLRLKGRAWISGDSGQVVHLETNLVEGILLIDLKEVAVSVDYAPVRFKAQDGEVWLPKFAVAYTDYAQRRMIIEHTFSDFQLFSVQTREDNQKPKEP